MLSTASNLAFYGTLDRWFKALDAKSGKELWKFQVSSGVIGNSFTYSYNGKQFVGAVSGVGGLAAAETYMLPDPTDAISGWGGWGIFHEVSLNNAKPGAGAVNVFSL